MLKYKLS